MKKLILLLLFIPLLSCQNGEVKTYYESGELQATGNYVDGLEQENGSIIMSQEN